MSAERNPIIPGPAHVEEPPKEFHLQQAFDKVCNLTDLRRLAALSGDLGAARELDRQIRETEAEIDRAVHGSSPPAPPVPQPRPPTRGEEGKLSRGLETLQLRISKLEVAKKKALAVAAEEPVPNFDRAVAIDGDMQVLAHQAGQIRTRLEEIDAWNLRRYQEKRQDESMAAYRRAEEKRKQARIELRRRVDELLPTIDAIKQLAAEAQDGQEIARLLEMLGGR